MADNCASCGQKVKSEENWPPMGKQRSFALELLHSAPQVRRHARRRRGNVEGRRSRTRDQVKRCSKSGL